jgi:hypothetical protein
MIVEEQVIKCNECRDWTGEGEKMCFHCPDWKLVTFFSSDYTEEDKLTIRAQLEERRHVERIEKEK